MYLYLMRHVEAEDLGSEGATRDANRPLTEKGQRQARRVGKMLKHLDVSFDLAFTSPFARARETAELVLEAMASDLKAKSLNELTPNSKDDAMWQAIARADGSSVLVVGHLPSIGSLAGSLLGSLSEQPLRFHKGSLAVLRCDKGDRKPRVSLEWMLSPSVMKRLATRRTHGTDADENA